MNVASTDSWAHWNTYSGDFATPSDNITIGAQHYTGGVWRYTVDGYIDEVRWSDVARYSAAANSNHNDELKMWHLKDRIGRLEFNPVTQKFQNINMSAYKFKTLSRTLTAVNYDESDYSMLYCPSDGINAYKPLELADGSQYIGWKHQGSGYATDSNICYEVEWRTVTSSITGYGDASTGAVVGGLNKLPIYYSTTNTRPVTGKYLNFGQGQGSIAMSRHLVRPRDRLPVASGTRHLSHQDHQVRRYDVYNVQNKALTGLDTGFIFGKPIGPLTGRAFNITMGSYPATTSSPVTSDRLFYEYKNREWDVADFTMFSGPSGLSATEFGLFLHATNNFSLVSPLTSSHSMLNLIGLCTFQGSPTAANGEFYCAAIARGNVPTWCHVVSSIGAASPGYENFVVCTTGCNLVLPYITYRAT